MYPSYHRRGRDMILHFLKKHFYDKEKLVTPIEPLQLETSEEELNALFCKSTFKEDYKILNCEIRKCSEQLSITSSVMWKKPVS